MDARLVIGREVSHVATRPQRANVDSRLHGRSVANNVEQQEPSAAERCVRPSFGGETAAEAEKTSSVTGGDKFRASQSGNDAAPRD
jgi:hypothetical protein